MKLPINISKSRSSSPEIEKNYPMTSGLANYIYPIIFVKSKKSEYVKLKTFKQVILINYFRNYLLRLGVHRSTKTSEPTVAKTSGKIHDKLP